MADSQNPDDSGILYKDFEAWKAQSQSFKDVAVYYRNSGWSRVTLTIGDEPESVQGAFVSSNFFPLMGVAPVLGRTFTAQEEEGHERVIVLSYALWINRFGRSPDVLGKSLQIDNANSTVIGVMPESFQFPARDQKFWAPISTNRWWNDPEITIYDSNHIRSFYGRWQTIARLRDGIPTERAQAEMNIIFERTLKDDPNEVRNIGISVIPLKVRVNGNTRLALFVLFGAVTLLLLVGCSNVANLVLARGVGRDREIALRVSLGATRARLLRQLLVENTLLSLLGGTIGIMLTIVGVRGLIIFAPPDIPRIEQSHIDSAALVFALVLSLFCAVAFGLVPALKVTQSNPGRILQSARSGIPRSAGLSYSRNAIVIVEFALAFVLLTASGLLVRSFLAIQSVDLGFRPEHILTLTVTTPSGTTDASRTHLYDSIIQRVRALPGVQSVGAVDGLFELGSIGTLGLREIQGRPSERKQHWTPLLWNTIRGDYLQAMGTPLVAGRYFSEEDGPDSPLVAIIDESMTRRYWAGENPIGKRFKGQDPRGNNDEWLTVIGVAKDMQRTGIERQPVPHVFEWYRQASSNVTPDFVVRTTGNSRVLAAALRSTVREVDSHAILSLVATMQEQLSQQLSPRRFQTQLLGLFSVIALLLACLGIFGTMHYSVAQRTHEIGVRLALGASKNDVMNSVLGRAVKLGLVGIVIGIGLALLLTRLMVSLLFGVAPDDALTLSCVALLVMATTLAASLLPALRAMRVDPMVALRYE